MLRATLTHLPSQLTALLPVGNVQCKCYNQTEEKGTAKTTTWSGRAYRPNGDAHSSLNLKDKLQSEFVTKAAQVVQHGKCCSESVYLGDHPHPALSLPSTSTVSGGATPCPRDRTPRPLSRLLAGLSLPPHPPIASRQPLSRKRGKPPCDPPGWAADTLYCFFAPETSGDEVPCAGSSLPLLIPAWQRRRDSGTSPQRARVRRTWRGWGASF